MFCLLVGSTAELPDYDRRFIGFGWNKVSHIYNLHKQGKLPMLYSLQRLSLLKFIYKIIVTGRHYIYNSFCKMTDTYLTPKDAQASVQIFILHNCTLLETIQNIWYYTCIFVNHCSLQSRYSPRLHVLGPARRLYHPSSSHTELRHSSFIQSWL